MKTIMKSLPLAVLMAVIFLTGCNEDDDAMVVDSKNIVEVAQEAGQFSILIQAAQKAGLDDFLSNENNLTVFAPTDDAFVSLLADLGLNSLDDLDASTLGNILKYHVIANEVLSSELTTGYFPTLSEFSGNNILMYINTENGVSLNQGISVTSADIEASNGVIHVVDKVIIPPSVVNIALANSNFSVLVDAVVKAGLVDALNGEGPFTVFAPTNSAFENLFSTLGITGIEDLSAEQLIPILTYHVVSGNVLSSDLATGEVSTLNSENNLMVDIGSGVMVNQSTVVAADIQGANGVVHVIDKVLLPE